MHTIPYRGYEIRPTVAQGKHGTLLKATESVRVCRVEGGGYYRNLKYVRFRLDDPNGRTKAIGKARAYIDHLIVSSFNPASYAVKVPSLK